MTGSGKTAAFALPVLQLVQETRRREREAKASGGGKGGGPPEWRMSDHDRDPVVGLAGDGVTVSVGAPRWAGARATAGITGGRVSQLDCHSTFEPPFSRRADFQIRWAASILFQVYYEVTVMDKGLGRFGWSTVSANLNLGTDSNGMGFGGTGMKSRGGNFEKYG